MIRLALLLFILFVVTGCSFDEQLYYDQRLPASLEIRNETPDEFSVKVIVNSLDATEAFVISNDSAILPGESYSTRITEDMYEDIRQGRFLIRGECENSGKERKIIGTTLTRHAIRNSKRYRVIVLISDCEL
jgi:hypothetical protein